jgi:hypothetical protein
MFKTTGKDRVRLKLPRPPIVEISKALHPTTIAPTSISIDTDLNFQNSFTMATTEGTPVPTADTTKTMTVGTRRSHLARIQTDIVVAAIQKAYPDVKCNVHAMDPLGDRDKITALYNFNAKSLWTEELEVLLDGGELDCIVHSLKGMWLLPN